MRVYFLGGVPHVLGDTTINENDHRLRKFPLPLFSFSPLLPCPLRGFLYEEENTMRFNVRSLFNRGLLTLFGILILVAIIGSIAGQFFYALERIEEQEVGIQFRQGRIYNIVEPGVYSDFGLFVEMVRISSQAIPFQVLDEEIITKDKQRIGLIVSGDVFRPGIAQKDLIRSLWAQYRGIYLEDDLAKSRIEDFAQQAMKVCVGDRTFDDNIIGTARDELRACIDDELNQLASTLGLRIENLVVPEVILSPEVQAALDAIVQSRLLTEKAAQDQLKANAEAGAEQARQEGEIRAEQSRIQEQTRQQITLAQLEQERLDAQLVVIESQRANDLANLETERQTIEVEKSNALLAAERDLAINEALAKAAVAKARADIAYQTVLAELYAGNPEYVQLLIVEANASALNQVDKIIFTPEGTIPTLVLPGPGIVPTVDVAPAPESTTP